LILGADQTTCVLSGCQTEEVLDAAHLPGRDWHFHNGITDGITLRTDLQRLLDRGLLIFDTNWKVVDVPLDYSMA
jgi:hypothetical protein